MKLPEGKIGINEFAMAINEVIDPLTSKKASGTVINNKLKVGSQGSMKSQMKKADQSGAIFALIMGERELEAGEFSVKELATADQSTVALSDIVSFIIDKLTSK